MRVQDAFAPAGDDAGDLLLFRGFFRCLLGGRLLLRLRSCLVLFFDGRRLHLLRFRFLLRKIGSLEALSAESDLGDADRGEWLAMSAKLLVLLLALVVKDQNFCAAAFA